MERLRGELDLSRDTARTGELRVGLLGPLEVWARGQRVRLTAGRLRTLLAVLAMSVGRPVSVDRLATALWDDELPDHPRRGVQTYVTRLRAVLGTGLIDTTATGYQLRAEPDQVDAVRFVRLLDVAAGTRDRDRLRAHLVGALALWRGAPFDGVRSDWLVRTETPLLVERYLAAVERRIDLDLTDGRHYALTAQLRGLIARYPLREPLWVRLLLVLDRCGRRAEALEEYEAVRNRLAEELGTEPGPELRQVYGGLLAGTPARQTRRSTYLR